MSTGAQIVADFAAALSRASGLTVTRGGASRNVWQVEGDAQCLLYIKGRGEAPYNWGVTAKVVERLQGKKQQWFTVLLFESKDSGYLLSSADVLYYIKHVWPLAADGDYKPATGTYLSHNVPFHSFEEFLRVLRTQAS